MSKEKAIDKINQAIFLIKPYFEGNLEAKRFTLKYLEDALKELEGDMTKFNVVRYWDTYPDGTVATCDTEEEAEKICNEYRRNCKPMYDYLVRKEGE
jgi:hypothetical protein